MAEELKDIDQVFWDALLIESADDREAFLHRACGDDEKLRLLIQKLIKVQPRAERFLEEPIRLGVIAETSAFAEQPGTIIGPYRLTEQIGEGGFGVVFLAEQERPVRRKVALKIIKPGMDTRQVIARFEAERQALAMMDHPNIAKVYDAGATENGRPYFVMELVRGVAVTDYCDRCNLTTQERLELFVTVCHAVQHAHQKGVIHRDIKPANVLVAIQDGQPAPKIIDFGVAKAINQRLTEHTFATGFAQILGTPMCMSPEQAELSQLGVDTRTDIYSLGVLLYELLTGTTPFDKDRLHSVPYDELRRIIREEDPPKPSTRVSTLQNNLLSTVAAERKIEPTKLSHSLRGDLDWIVMKCLEKDRARRYESASGLAMDILRYLNDEAITARPPTNLYRLQKLVLRNKIAVAAASAVVAALVIGLGISTWMFFKEKAARQLAVAAEQEQVRLRRQAEQDKQMAIAAAAKSAQIATFMQDMLKGVGPSVALGRDTKMLREILDRTVERVGSDLQDQADVKAELLTTLGRVYQDLGEYSQAETTLRQALMIREEQLGDGHPKVADSLGELGSAIHAAGRHTEAESIHRQVLAMRRKLLGSGHADVATSHNNLAEALQYQSRYSEAEQHFREALAIRRKLFGDEHPDVATSLQDLASVLQKQVKFDEIEAMQREALEIRRKIFGEKHPEVAHSIQSVSSALGALGRFDEAEVLAREALAMRRQIFGNEHPEVVGPNGSLGYMAEALRNQHKLGEAEVVLRELLATRRKLYGSEPLYVMWSLSDLADVLRQGGKLNEAESLYREALALQRKLSGDTHASVAESCYNLATVLNGQGKTEEAERVFNDILTPELEIQPQAARLLRLRADFRTRTGRWKEAAMDFWKVIEFEPEDHVHYHLLAPLLVRNGDLEGYQRLRARIVERFGATADPVIAERMAKDCLILPASGAELDTLARMADTTIAAAPDHWGATFFQFAKGLSEYRQGHFDRAAEWMEKVLAKTGEFDFRDAQAHMVLAMARHRLNQADQARAALAKGNEIAKPRLEQLETDDPGDYWHDWIIVQALQREAQALIESPVSATDESPP